MKTLVDRLRDGLVGTIPRRSCRWFRDRGIDAVWCSAETDAHLKYGCAVVNPDCIKTARLVSG